MQSNPLGCSLAYSAWWVDCDPPFLSSFSLFFSQCNDYYIKYNLMNISVAYYACRLKYASMSAVWHLTRPRWQECENVDKLSLICSGFINWGYKFMNLFKCFHGFKTRESQNTKEINQTKPKQRAETKTKPEKQNGSPTLHAICKPWTMHQAGWREGRRQVVIVLDLFKMSFQNKE